MGIELRQQIKMNQSLVMTPQLQMAIKLLQLSRLELLEVIQQELEQNPALDEVSESISPEDQEMTSDDVAEKEVTIDENISDDIDWSNYIDEYNSASRIDFESEGRDTPRFEAFISQKESLSDHLLWQLMMTSPTDEEKEIGSLIIGNISKSGYLDIPVEEIVRISDSSPEKVEQVLSLLQTFDPVGVCARNLRECLLIQARHLKFEDSIVTDIIENHLPHLENKNYSAVCREMKANMEEVIFAVNVIKGLEPRPGRLFSDEDPQYIEPDIYIYKLEDDFVIILNEDGMPKLKISSFYQEAIEKDGNLTENIKEYMQEKLRSATWLIKSIHQRQKTIYRVMESIMKFQGDFFEKGVTHLKPMVLKDVAEDIDMHESTVSRVTTNKYVYTPQGIFELKYFFNSSINPIHGNDAISSASVQEHIKLIIESEDPAKPYSDDKISKLLEDENINIARRTVAKYREMMKILPSNKRKQV
ncbi:RNA polymerase factor sigma-54 [Desulfobacterales bacterium HSG2]|nr:RNA polymerase factor sigma-54 [Desulfobacterales bacterium HSG2]